MREFILQDSANVNHSGRLWEIYGLGSCRENSVETSEPQISNVDQKEPFLSV